MQTQNQLSAKTIARASLWMTAIGQLGIVVYLPAFPEMVQVFHTTNAMIQNSLAAFLIGFGCSQLLYGIWSDHKGRKQVLVISLLAFLITLLATFFVHSAGLYIFIRLLQGITVGATMTISRVILRDSFNDTYLPKAAAYPSLGFAVGLGFGPVVSGWLTSHFGWQSCTAFLAAFTTVYLIWFWFAFPETHAKENRPTAKPTVKKLLQMHLNVVTHRQFIQLLFGGIFAYSVVTTYNVLSPFLLQNTFHLTAKQYGNVAVLIAIAYYAGAWLNKHIVLRLGSFNVIKIGLALIMVAGLTLILWSIWHEKALIPFLIGTFVAVFGQALVWSNIIASSIRFFKENAGVASAVFSCLQMVFTGIISSTLSLVPSHSTITIAIIFLLLGIIAYSVVRPIIKNK